MANQSSEGGREGALEAALRIHACPLLACLQNFHCCSHSQCLVRVTPKVRISIFLNRGLNINPRLSGVQGTRKKYVFFAKQDPGRVRQNSQARAGRNFSQPRTNIFRVLCIRSQRERERNKSLPRSPPSAPAPPWANAYMLSSSAGE